MWTALRLSGILPRDCGGRSCAGTGHNAILVLNPVGGILLLPTVADGVGLKSPRSGPPFVVRMSKWIQTLEQLVGNTKPIPA